MKRFYKILLIIIGIAYLISPVDLIPDFMIPYIGWLDDAVVLWLIFYYLKNNRLPSFFYRQKKTSENNKNHSNNNANANYNNTDNHDYKNNYNHTKNNNYNGDSDSNGYNTRQNNNKPDKNPYDILGIDKNASEQEIRAAYRKLVKQYHPDRVAGLGKEFQDLANKKFIEIKEAYNCLMKS